MKKFSFTLQALLTVNLSLEKEQKNQLAIINNCINKLESERNTIMSEIESSINFYLKLIKNSLNINQIKSYNDYFKVLNNKIILIDKKIEHENIEKQKVQVMLVETMAKIKSLEKLKDKQYEVYLKEIQKEEEKTIDDFASHAYTNQLKRR